MGLDMYAYAANPKEITAKTDFEIEGRKELHYWRKHPNLHGWMEDLYREKGGREPEFNCASVLLEEADLDALEAAIRECSLPSTSGLFFGESDGSETNDDLEFVAKARDAIQAGRAVFYTSSW